MTAHTVRHARRTLHAGQLTELRCALEEQLMFRVEQLLQLAAEASDRSATPAEDPRAAVAEALRQAASAALSDVRAALARLDAGTYGSCQSCGGAIQLERLEVVPMAALCLRCAQAVRHRSYDSEQEVR